MSNSPHDSAFDPTAKYDLPYDDAALKRARDLLSSMPENVGPYRILERIGGGGMGDVYRAEQRTPIRRQVALKFIKLGMDSKSVITRFEAERQALALMDHPHIAKVFDAGTDEIGRPYFVMEYVKGKPITEYCDLNHLNIAERLKLFEQICQAVQHAHHKGVIHRDLKPGNVLVGTQDGEPCAKVIDFGVAKAISQKLTDATMFTQHDQFIGTPQYMSPEQASGIVDIDTRTDVYSLGVLLYELLTGTTPFSTAELRAAAFEKMKKMIIEVDPPKPSTRLGPNTPTLSSLATFRRTEPKRLGTLVQGELDWIVMKSIDKDRRRRYETPTSLANDILAHLNGEPVQAAPPSAAYRIQKFVGKNRGLVLGTAAVMTALLVGVCGTTWGLLRARIAEKAAIISEQKKDEQRILAEAATESEAKQRAKAERQFVTGLLRPIGWDRISTNQLTQSELRSLVDWSALGNSRLSSLALEVAFEDPATAIRVGRQSDLVIQACVGLSTARRARAISFVSAQQRDLQADPRIRIAACRLALELGSTDLPALSECIKALDKCAITDRGYLMDLVKLAVSRNKTKESRATIQEIATSLIQLLNVDMENLSRKDVHDTLTELCDDLSPQQFEAWADEVIAAVESESKRKDRLCIATECELKGMVDKFTSAQVMRLTDALIASFATRRVSAIRRLVELRPRLNPEQLTVVWQALLPLIEPNLVDTSHPDPEFVWTDYTAVQALVNLSAQIPADNVEWAYGSLLQIILKSTDENHRVAALDAAAGLVPRLTDEQIKGLFEAWIKRSNSATDETRSIELRFNAVAGLVPRLSPEQVSILWDETIKLYLRDATLYEIYKSEYSSEIVTMLARRLSPSALKLKVMDLITSLPSVVKDSFVSQRILVSVIAAAIPALAMDDIPAVADATILLFEAILNDSSRNSASMIITGLAPYLNAEQVRRIWDAIVFYLKQTTLEDHPDKDGLGAALASLVPRLTEERAAIEFDVLKTILEKTMSPYVVEQVSAGLVVLGPRARPEQISRGLQVLLIRLDRWSGENLIKAVAALGCRTGRDDSLKACETLIDFLRVGPRFRFPAEGDRVVSHLRYLELSEEREKRRDEAGDALVALVSVLSQQDRLRLAESLFREIPGIDEGWQISDFFLESQSCHAIAAILKMLNSTERDRVSEKLLVLLMDLQTTFMNQPGASHDEMVECIRHAATAIPAPRTIARLLSHPICVGRRREFMLQRLEELLFHNGDAVYLTPDSSDKSIEVVSSKPASPPRRFHTIHDAAAWIRQNWPDFDLETNHPVQWRSNRE